MRKFRTAITGFAALCLLAVLPAAASAACALPSVSNEMLNGTTHEFEGHFEPELNGKFIQIPFEVEDGTRGMRIRYCYARAAGGESDDNPTLDLGVYEARPAGASNWTQDQRRGWSGSAVKAIGIGENGYSDEDTYNSGRKNYVPGRTTRAYRPGPIPPGQWAVELGAGWIDPDGEGIDWKVEVVTSSDEDWGDNAFEPEPYEPKTANSNPGWYTGDFHVHGEMEPGNATMKQTFDLGFKPLSQGGGGLDFMTLVDHNNDNALSLLGRSEYSYPGKLVIPGIEVTTYNGHANAQFSSNFADFRFSDVYKWNDNGDKTQTPEELSLVREAIDPSSQFQTILDGGGFTQVNHPDTARDAPALCRGCAWTYSDGRTDWSKVNALEIQNGPAGIPLASPNSMNPFTIEAIASYERLLAAGNHIAAVGSSDDHQAGNSSGPFDSVVGRGATAVYASELSPDSIVDAVKAGHTYVKFFGADAPDVELKAGQPGKADLNAIPGDSVSGPSMNIQLHVTGAGASATRPGPYTLEILQDGVQIDSVAVTGDDFRHNLNVKETGRYSFKLTRPISASETAIEAYSTPVWFSRPSRAFRFAGYKVNRKRGTAKLKVKVASPGKVTLNGRGLRKVRKKVRRNNQTVTLNLRPRAWLKKKLRKRGRVRVKIRVRNKPVGARALAKTRTMKLVAVKPKKKGRR